MLTQLSIPGVVDKHIKEIEKTILPTCQEGEKFMDTFLKEVLVNRCLLKITSCLVQNCIIRKRKQGKASLEGNQSREFLQKTDRLENAFYRAGAAVAVKGLPFIASLRSFNVVVEKCFQVELKEGYKDSISMFAKKYGELGVTITPKVFRISHVIRNQVYNFHLLGTHGDFSHSGLFESER